MKLQFKKQKFQADAAKAVVDIFVGQPYSVPSYMIDRGVTGKQQALDIEDGFTGWGNQKITPALTDEIILERIQKIQRANLIQPSDRLEGRYNLTIEMETGVGKTYTYIKTMYELNKAYGWSKFIVVVPSIAIREGVYKTFQVTQEHFAEEYGKKVRFFIYNSARLTEIEHFASDNAINVMIINAQAFNATGKDARRIEKKLDEFRSRRPIDVLAKTNPILIIDEPQSVEGTKTKEKLKKFNPLFTLRYSATHREKYNMIYRLDAMEAYNKKLVKKIRVVGIAATGSTGTESYVYLEGINLSAKAPTATIEFDCKGANGIRKITRIVGEGYNLYDNSNQLEEYKSGFTVARIDGRESANFIEFLNGIRIYAGDVIGKVSEEQLRRIQIRETIKAHIEREQELFDKGIKVLSLFFIDEVAKYKQYNSAGEAENGIYGQIFEEEYRNIVGNLQTSLEDEAYQEYLSAIAPEKTHAGYFSVDKKGRIIDSKLKRREESSNTQDALDAYDLIMKNKELLLERNPQKSPVRFIFSHSALREGWDNPNVFQICTLKQSNSETGKRQEVGRGLRLCVNQDGDRMDENVLGKSVQEVNLLTVIASESYDSFARGLQGELAEVVADRPRIVNRELFVDRAVKDIAGNDVIIDDDMATAILYELITQKYIDKKGQLTDKYYQDKNENRVQIAQEASEIASAVLEILDGIYNSNGMEIENARSNNVELRLEADKLAMPEFQALWKRINAKSAYTVDFVSEELVQKSIEAINKQLYVAPVHIEVVQGTLDRIESQGQLAEGTAFVKERTVRKEKIKAASEVKYDLIGKLVEETGLTRKDIVQILQGIRGDLFAQFKINPEEFILKTAKLINNEKAVAVIQHIAYNMTEAEYSTDIFADSSIKGRLGINAIKTKKHIYDHLVFDSITERQFASELDVSAEVAVYVKLPNTFYISTPVGKYNPDWAIAFFEGQVKHIYFVAETKGSMDSMQLKPIEQSKIECAKRHFKAISDEKVMYHVVNSYSDLLNIVTK